MAVKFRAKTSPCTDSFEYGVVVPMPTLPLLSTRKLVAVEEPMTKAGMPALLVTERLAKGEVVPMPVLPTESTINEVAVDEPMTNAFWPAREFIASWAKGVVVPIPTFPPFAIVR